MPTLLDNVSVDTVGDVKTWSGGDAQLFVQADNFGGGSVIVEVSADGNTWIQERFADGTLFSVTANGTFTVKKWGQSTSVRASLVGSTGASNVTVIAKL